MSFPGPFQFLKEISDNTLDVSANTLAVRNSQNPAASAASVTVSSSVAATSEESTTIGAQGREQISVVASGLGANLTIEVHLLDSGGARVHLLQTITADGLTTINLAWPSIQLVRKNAGVTPATIGAVYALR